MSRSMLAGIGVVWRTTVRRCRHSAAGLSVVPAAGLPQGEATPEIPGGHPRSRPEREIALAEVPRERDLVAEELGEPGTHPPYYRGMGENDQTGLIKTAHGELTIEQIADALPSTGDLMALVGSSWWKCAYAARGGNWPLAAYFARRVRSLQRKLAVLRPKHRERLTAFETDQLVPLFRAIEATDVAAFEVAFAAATASANQSHVETGYAYIRWVLPEGPPTDLDLT